MKGESMGLIEKGRRILPARQHSSTPPFANAIRVHSVAREYEIIHRQRCDCGGKFQPKRQSLLASEDGHYDLIETECEACNKPRDFLFDISDWFARWAKVS